MEYDKFIIYDFSGKDHDLLKRKNIKYPDAVYNFEMKEESIDRMFSPFTFLETAADSNNFILFFGFENIVGFEEKDKAEEIIKKIKQNIGKNIFIIITSYSSLFFLKKKETKDLMNILQPYFLITGIDDYGYLKEFRKYIKTKNIALYNISAKDLSALEAEWINNNCASVLLLNNNVTAYRNKLSQVKLSSIDINKVLIEYIKIV